MEKGKNNTTTLVEMAREYNVTRRTMYNWILPIRQELLKMHPLPIKNLNILLPKQVKLVHKFLGE